MLYYYDVKYSFHDIKIFIFISPVFNIKYKTCTFKVKLINNVKTDYLIEYDSNVYEIRRNNTLMNSENSN